VALPVALPVHFPLNYFKQFDKLCNSFLWNNKKPILNLRKLQKPVDKGGLGMPNLLMYHYAISLRHLAHWFLPPKKPHPWFGLESLASSPFTTFNSLSTNLAPHNQSHPVLSHLKGMRKKVSKTFQFDPHLTRSSGIWQNPKLCIGKIPFFWKSWFQKGISVLGDLYENDAQNCHNKKIKK